MKTLSSPLLLTLAALTGALFLACSDDEKPRPSDPSDDAGAGGRVATGGAASTGGVAGAGGGAGGAEEDAGAGGTPSAGGAGAGGAGAGGALDAGAGGAEGDGSPCDSVFRCSTPYFPVPHPVENPFDPASATHRAKALLGKVLFWEEQIGELGTVACGTCHRGSAGGSDPRSALAESLKPGLLASTDDDVRGGMGVPKCEEADGGLPISDPTVQVTGRKPPTYLDAMFGLEIFWDGRAGFCRNGEAAGGCFYDPDLPPGSAPIIMAAPDPVSGSTAGGALEAQAVGPPVNDVEMACARQTWADIHEVLRTARPLDKASARPVDMERFITNNGTSYPQMFAAAFGSTAKLSPSDPNTVINTRRIAFAIATHERNLTSDQTPWDRWNAGDDTALTARQVQGFELFMNTTKGKCSTCHAPPLFTNNAFHYIGFHHPDWDQGRAAITGLPGEAGMAKTPTLRNVGLREAGGLLKSGAGPGASLDTIMALYKTGGAFRGDPAVSPFIDGSITVLNLNQLEMDAIIDFVRNGLTDPRVRNETAPFDRPQLSTE